MEPKDTINILINFFYTSIRDIHLPNHTSTQQHSLAPRIPKRISSTAVNTGREVLDGHDAIRSRFTKQRVGFWDLTYRNIVGRASSPTKMNVFNRVYAEILDVKVTAKL